MLTAFNIYLGYRGYVIFLYCILAEFPYPFPKILLPLYLKELFDSIAPQSTENRTVANSLPAFLKYSVKCLFLKRLCQAVENLK